MCYESLCQYINLPSLNIIFNSFGLSNVLCTYLFANVIKTTFNLFSIPQNPGKKLFISSDKKGPEAKEKKPLRLEKERLKEEG